MLSLILISEGSKCRPATFTAGVTEIGGKLEKYTINQAGTPYLRDESLSNIRAVTRLFEFSLRPEMFKSATYKEAAAFLIQLECHRTIRHPSILPRDPDSFSRGKPRSS